MKVFGLIGKKLDHSFSPQYFRQKFKNEDLRDIYYHLYPLHHINEFNLLIKNNSDISGLNVTIPYKSEIMPFLDEITPAAQKIGAVNTIKFNRINQSIKLIGYNTDYLGFMESLKPLLQDCHKNALVLGSGGSSKAIAYGLDMLNIKFKVVSRNPQGSDQISYQSITKDLIKAHPLIINTTPVGMFPHISQKPDIPYEELTEKHLLYDLIYNPEKTKFLQQGEKMGCKIKNGFEMLKIQADYAWKIWNDIKF
ncbi:MAG: shikimate dehydrogenase [Bacteroidales bacterium]